MPRTPVIAALRADGVSHAYRARRVLTDVSLTVAPGARVGLIGENGTGKSTLLRLLAGVEEADAGRIRRPERTGLLWQEPPFAPADTVAEVLDDALDEARRLERALVDAGDALSRGNGAPAVHGALRRAFDDAMDAATLAEVWTAEARRDTTLDALGLGDLDRRRTVAELSGGQRARLSLAWLLVRRPTALLLDEPTNHLDDAGIEFLRRTLDGWSGPVLFASHDRAFLDEAASGIVDLDPAMREGEGVELDALGRVVASQRAVSAPAAAAPDAAGPAATASGTVARGPGAAASDARAADAASRAADDEARAIAHGEDPHAMSGRGLTVYGGSFSDYLLERARRRERWRARHARERAELDRLAALAERARDGGRADRQRTEVRAAKKFYADRAAKVASQRVREAERRASTLAAAAVGPPPEPLRFRPPLGALDLEPGPVVAAAGAAVAGRLAPVTLALGPGDALLVTGANGAGKSTLLHLLAGRLAPTSGRAATAPGLRIGLLEQDAEFERLDRPTIEAYRDAVGRERADVAPLDGFGLFTRADARRPIGELSVGQRRRLALAIVLADPPDLLLLDEPTNHLSLALATELEQAIAGYAGALVVATHDRWARRRWQGDHVELVPAASE